MTIPKFPILSLNSIFTFALSAICLFAISGCGNDYAETAVYPTSGSVTVDGKPVYGAFITFHPVGDVGLTRGDKPFARSDEQGNFQATMYNTNDGAPAGDYVLTVIWPTDPDARGPSPDLLKGRYKSEETSGLQVTVAASKTELPVLELKTN